MAKDTRIGDAAAEVGVSRQTVRNYLNKLPGYFSSSATRQHGKRFTPADMRQLIEIKRLLDAGTPFDRVSDELDPVPQIIDPDPVVTQPIDPGQAQDFQPPATRDGFEYFTELVKKLQDQTEKTIKAKDDQIADLKTDKDRMQKELAWHRLPWWRKLFQDPPQ